MSLKKDISTQINQLVAVETAAILFVKRVVIRLFVSTK